MMGVRVPAGQLLLGAALCACTRLTELLPRADAGGRSADTEEVKSLDASVDIDRPAKSFCPTTIDVYGGINMTLAGCGGPSQGPLPLEGGFGNPRLGDGGPEYANTMAGRLQARLVADPDLVPTFGPAWQVRSCAAPPETLPTLVAPLSEDSCGADSPTQMGTLSTICSDQPAPLVLISAGALDDRCHGGGPDSSLPDDVATFANHFALRLDALLVARQPQLAMVGPQTEWYASSGPVGQHSQPAQSAPPGGPPDRSGCDWQRPDWATSGVNAWQASHAAAMEVLVVGDLHGAFKQHSSCCQALGVTCATDWMSSNGPNQTVVNCDGAQALVDFWYGQLKSFLLGNRFSCT